MTARKMSHRYLSAAAATPAPASSDDVLELDETEVWSTNDVVILPEPKTHAHQHPRPARKPLRAKSSAVDRLPKSLPVNVPDWSKILGGEYRRGARELVDDDDEDEEEGGNDRMPPHEYLAITRGASSFSVGRRLKGRDLSRVRNAIWKQIGFED